MSIYDLLGFVYVIVYDRDFLLILMKRNHIVMAFMVQCVL